MCPGLQKKYMCVRGEPRPGCCDNPRFLKCDVFTDFLISIRLQEAGGSAIFYTIFLKTCHTPYIYLLRLKHKNHKICSISHISLKFTNFVAFLFSTILPVFLHLRPLKVLFLDTEPLR